MAAETANGDSARLRTMHYQRNFLTKVVLRLDFEAIPQLRESTRVDVKPEFSNRIAGLYPIVAGQAMGTVSVNIGPMGSGVNQQITGIQWTHKKAADGTSIVAIAPDYLAIEYGKDDYNHFPPFREEARQVIELLIDLYRVAAFTRIGLRYINQVNLAEGNPLDWHNLLAPELVTGVMAGRDPDMDMVRSMHQLHVRRNESAMLFNYGLHNPDFPNTLARRVFILDYDCSKMGVLPNDALQAIDNLNGFCEGMFERSIQNGLRDIMGVID